MSSSTNSLSNLGGKAFGLGKMAQAGLPVPPGIILDAIPSPTDWIQIESWWKKLAYTPLAVRSSATAEDGAETSFAGQNKSFLNVSGLENLKTAILKCFASINETPSQAYREFFSANPQTEFEFQNSRMNVVLQQMVIPQFSGVFFSRDPRKSAVDTNSWVVEVVAGLGEALVSGSVTPGQVLESGGCKNLPSGFTKERANQIAEYGKQVSQVMGFLIDMEWAIDANNQVHILQARPITTSHDSDFIDYELNRLEKSYSLATTWDGQTFSEWSGFPSYFTFSIWRRAFSPRHAFGNALRELGYQSFPKKGKAPVSLLERIFGRAYINLDLMSDLYYGPIPFTMQPKPRPHTVFDPSKLTLRMILRMPKVLWKMLVVGWSLSTKRSEWLNQCAQSLNQFSAQNIQLFQADKGAQMSDAQLAELLEQKVDKFATTTLHWPLVLVVLTESTLQRLRLMMVGIFGEEKADQKIREWLGKGLSTCTLEMHENYQRAMQNPEQRAYFLKRYGHRGPGEMDLVNPRWSEMETKAFAKQLGPVMDAPKNQDLQVETEIKNMKSYKRDIILDEWRLLKKMLEHRELWKMEILKPYAQLRELALYVGQRRQIGNDIFWLRLSEITNMNHWENGRISDHLKEKIKDRKARFKAFRKYSFPEIMTLGDCKNILTGSEDASTSLSMNGEPLSPGLVYGEIRVVLDPTEVDVSTWPENVILVARATDPGWTPLFARARAIVVEYGGVLSHCAIVAREMGVPAVSGILGATNKFKDGDKIWVDGNLGKLNFEVGG